MIIALPYCHKDIRQAYKVVCWMSFLSQENGDSMRQEQILLIPSRHAAQKAIHKDLLAVSTKTFGKAHCHVPATENEEGWPVSCNFMFREALFHVEQFFPGEDMFWMEPDAVPLQPRWFNIIKLEWARAWSSGERFMGAFVQTPSKHMSGVGVYPINWRKWCPSLADESPEPWDIRCAPAIMPNACFTPLIRHRVEVVPITRCDQFDHRAPSNMLPNVKPCVYHKDKDCAIPALLDAEHYGGRAEAQFHFSRIPTSERVPMKFYMAQNISRLIRSQGHAFAFDSIGIFGGAHQGVFATENESEVIALDALAGNPASGVTAISQSDYEGTTKKKVFSVSPDHKPEIIQSDPRILDPVRVSEKGAGVVVVPEFSAVKAQISETPITSIDELVKIGHVMPSDLGIAPKKKGGWPKGKPRK